MAKFETKQEIDEWYASAIDGLGRAGAYDVSRGSEGINAYLVATRALGEVKKHLYDAFELEDEVL